MISTEIDHLMQFAASLPWPEGSSLEVTVEDPYGTIRIGLVWANGYGCHQLRSRRGGTDGYRHAIRELSLRASDIEVLLRPS